ncbi:MAG TPA: VWA domain-containing protein [Pyrinomonadaceae bacterium]|nr:VWA domain-containing protein [Pyrinomonadaceae bacterium]
MSKSNRNLRNTSIALISSPLRRAGVCLAALLLAAFICLPIVDSQNPSGIRVELPANSQLRVENQFGDINITVSSERDVLVTAEVVGSTSRTSPVVVETNQNLLIISVAGNAQSGPQRVNLDVRIPEKTRAEIVTGDGKIITRGMPASLSLNTVNGNILTELDPLNTDVAAKATNGVVQSSIAAENGDGHNYRFRFGPGQKLLRANSQNGEIMINPVGAGIGTGVGAPVLRGSSTGTQAAGTPAAQSNSEEVDEGDIIRVDAQLVALNLSVVDRGTSKGVAGLNQSDFKLFENGVEQRVLNFESSSAPFDLVLLIDLSGSTRDVVKLIRAAARRFVDAARPSDRIAIITFAGRPTVVSSLTLDREVLRKRVDTIDTVSGDTKLYDAGTFAMEEVARQTKNSRRAAVVLMSDGLDGSIPGVQGDGSKLEYREFLNNVREFDGVLYTLWLNTYYEALNEQDTQPEAFDMGHDRMKELADAGGGMFYEVEGLEDLAGAYERVVSDLGTVYSLAYRPSDKGRDGKWRAIKVNVSRSNAVARGKHGYYAN